MLNRILQWLVVLLAVSLTFVPGLESLYMCDWLSETVGYNTCA